MPLDAAEGGITLAEENLARTLAACARFQTWCGVANETAALARIHFDALPVPENQRSVLSRDQIEGLRPFALIGTNPQGGYSRGRVATETYAEAGSLTIVLEENVPERLAHDDAAAARAFKNMLGVILGELLALAYEPTYLAIDQVTLQGPLRCHPDDVVGQGDHQFAGLAVSYGVGQQK